jgi:gamma-glutamylcyclotransferase (GGCT)/AIG2-like uncharacterized protein YtfP
MQTPGENQRLYFAYGSNLRLRQMCAPDPDPELVRRGRENRCPGCTPLRPYMLEGFKLEFRGTRTRWGTGGVATIITDPAGAVPGAVYGLTPENEAVLDRMEGVAAGLYYREEGIITLQGKPVLVYIGTAQLAPENKPNISYLETMRAGYRDWGLPLSVLAGIPTYPAED